MNDLDELITPAHRLDLTACRDRAERLITAAMSGRGVARRAPTTPIAARPTEPRARHILPGCPATLTSRDRGHGPCLCIREQVTRTLPTPTRPTTTKPRPAGPGGMRGSRPGKHLL